MTALPIATDRATWAEQTTRAALADCQAALDQARGALRRGLITGGEHVELCRAAIDRCADCIGRRIVIAGLADAERARVAGR